MGKPRIFFVINSLAGGGAERVMLALLAHSHDLRERFDISLVLLDREPRDYVPPPWLRIHQLDGRFSLVRSLAQFVTLLRRERPSATLSFLTRANVVSVFAARLLGHPAVISERANTSGHFAPGLAGQIAQQLVRAAYPRARAVIAVSQGIADDLLEGYGVEPRMLSVIPNPVDCAAIRAAAALPPAVQWDRPYLVAVSRLTRGKNVAMIVEALARAETDLGLLILGQGPERAAIEAQVSALGLADRVRLCGFQENPHAIMARARAYVSASNGEGFPNGLVEALALGLPAVVTNCASGPSEILADQRRQNVQGLTVAAYGVLTPPNDVELLARGIEVIVEPELHARLAKVGPVRAAEYSTARAKTAYWQVIESALGNLD